MNKNDLIRRIDVAAVRTPAEVVIKNGQILDVFNGEIISGDIAIVDGQPASVNTVGKPMIDKIFETKLAGKRIDGQAAGLSAMDLNIYIAAGIRTDHESTTAEEAKERLKKGMYLMIREGTVAKDLRQLIGVVNEGNSRRCLLVTDDKLIDYLVDEGSIDFNVKLAI